MYAQNIDIREFLLQIDFGDLNVALRVSISKSW